MSKLSSFLIISLMVIWVSAGICADPDQNLTLYDAVQTALKHNPDVQMAQEAVKQSRSYLDMTQALFMPSVRVYSEYLYSNAPSLYLFKTVDQRNLPADADFNNPGEFTNLETGMTATYNLYNGGRDKSSQKIKQSQFEEKMATDAAVKNRIAAEVISLYYNCLEAEKYIRIAKKSEETVKEQLRIMEVRFKGGGVLKSDILSLKVRLAEAQENVLKSKNNFSTLMIMMNAILGNGMNQNYKLTGDDMTHMDILTDENAGIETAFTKRPEILSVQSKINQAELAVKATTQGYLPKIDLNGGLYTDADGENISESGDDWNWMVGVALNWDVFTGNTTRKEKDIALADLMQVRHMERKLRADIEKDVRIAYMKLRESEERYLVAEKSVDMAEESLFLVKKRYEGGSESISTYLETELARSRAAMNSASAFYDRKKSLAGIARSTALLLEEYTQKGTSESDGMEGTE